MYYRNWAIDKIDYSEFEELWDEDSRSTMNLKDHIHILGLLE